MPRFNSAKDAAFWGDGGQDGFPESAPLWPKARAVATARPQADNHGAVLATLNQIQMLAETLAETSLDPMQQELVEFLVDAGMTLRREVLGADSTPEAEELELDDLADALAPRLATQDYLDFDIGDEIFFENRQRLNLVSDNSDLFRLTPAPNPALDDDLIVEDFASEDYYKTPPSAVALSAPAQPLEHLRLLMADDNVAQQSATRMLLEDLGAACSVTNVGAAAELVRMSAWDAILIDVQMPARAGLSAMRTIRADEVGSGKYRTPIFAFLSHASPEQIRECLNAGADGYLPKPLNKDAAVQQLEVLSIEQSLDRRSANF
ncbi:MAG: response regulator [Caulobacterales bacterium]